MTRLDLVKANKATCAATDALYALSQPTAAEIAAAAWTATEGLGLSGEARLVSMLDRVKCHFDHLQADVIAACRKKALKCASQPTIRRAKTT